MKKIYLLLIITFAFSLIYSIEISGEMYGKNTWTKKESPIYITGDIVIPSQSSLKIEPGVEIIFKGYYQILVNGAFEAIGNPDDTIVFTYEQSSLRKRTFWKGIVLHGENCSAVISDCIIEYAFRNMFYKARESNTLIIRNTVFRHNNYGVYCSNIKSMMVIKNIFRDNNYGIYCDYSSPTIQGNSITNNEVGIYCIFTSSPLIGKNILKNNRYKDIFLDDSMGENRTTLRNQYIWSLVKGLL